MVPILVEYQGKQCTFRELSEKTGVSYQTLLGRYHRGKRGDDLVITSRSKQKKTYKFNGEMLTMNEIASRAGKSVSAVCSCYYRYGNFKYINKPDQRTVKAKVLCTIKGAAYKASDLTRLFGISRQAISIHYHSKNEKEFKNWVIKKLENTGV